MLLTWACIRSRSTLLSAHPREADSTRGYTTWRYHRAGGEARTDLEADQLRRLRVEVGHEDVFCAHVRQ